MGYLFNDYIALKGRMTDEVHRIWKEADGAESRYYPCIFLEGMRKTMKNLSG
jgi:hypothetical protein